MLSSRTKKTARNPPDELLITSDSDDVFVVCDREKAVRSSKKEGVKVNTIKRTETKNETKECLGVESGHNDREMTPEEIKSEEHVLQKAENDLKELKIKVEEKEVKFQKILSELKRMAYVFKRVREIDISTAGKEFKNHSLVRFINIK